MSTQRVKKAAAAAPEFEFGGPVGVIGVIALCVATVYGLFYLCNDQGCFELQTLSIPPLSKQPIFTWEGLAVPCGWLFFHAMLYILVPGEMVDGTPLKESGKRLKYKCNGLRCFFISIGTAVALWAAGVIRASYIYDNFLAICTGALLLSAALAVYLYIKAALDRSGKNLSPGGNTGYILYDFWIGRQLNPRIGNTHFDWKFFCELRPGMSAWVLINLSFVATQYERYGYVTNSMILINIFELIYVMDSVWVESAILTTLDIINDGFGFMLSFGDLCWVPLVYSLQARYLVANPVHLSPVMLAAVLLVQITGYYIFRTSNNEKDAFRSNPDSPAVRHFKFLQTSTGRKLLTSGWWGRSRHPNYLGDWLMAWAWCLTSGFNHVIPYFYVAYFAVLLIHRQMRDDHLCRHKYGKDWDKYCQLVPYRIVPYLY